MCFRCNSTCLYFSPEKAQLTEANFKGAFEGTMEIESESSIQIGGFNKLGFPDISRSQILIFPGLTFNIELRIVRQENDEGFQVTAYSCMNLSKFH